MAATPKNRLSKKLHEVWHSGARHSSGILWKRTLLTGAIILAGICGSPSAHLQEQTGSLTAHIQEYTAPLTVHAQAQTGTIELQINKEAVGAEITLYTVADWEDGSYIYNSDFSASNVTITDLNDSLAAEAAAENLAAYAAEKKISGKTGIVGTDGTLIFDQLERALYLVAHTGGTGSVDVQSSLIEVPRLLDGTENYHVVITPKFSLPSGALIATKIDEMGETLSQAYFVLQGKVYTDDIPEGCTREADENGSYYWKEYMTDLVSSEEGQIVLTNLPRGSYRLVETKAPEGYVLAEDPTLFTITESGTVEPVNGVYQAASGKVETIKIINYHEETEEETEVETEVQESSSSGSSGGSKGSGSSGSNVKTGDETPLGLYATLLILSVLLLAGLLLRRYFRRK